MKICSVCGFECEEEITVCPTCGRNCDGSEQPKKENSSAVTDPFERYRREIDNQIKEQEKRIHDLQQKIDTENEEKSGKKTKNKGFNEFDRTELFSEEDAKENRLFAVLIYLTGAFGIIIALLKDKDSPYLRFHIKEGLKAVLSEAVILMLSFLLCFTFIIPVTGAVALLIINIIKLISAFRTLNGQSMEILILRKIDIFKE